MNMKTKYNCRACNTKSKQNALSLNIKACTSDITNKHGLGCGHCGRWFDEPIELVEINTTKIFRDPSRQEIVDFMEHIYPLCSDEPLHTELESEQDKHDGCACRFDIECAIYWIATHYHGGQASNLYSVLSMSDYSPPMCSGDELPDNDELFVATELYNQCSDWIERL